MAVPMNSANFRATVEPILNKEFDGLYDNRPDEYAQVFREFTGIPRAYHEEPVDYGFGIAPELPEGSPVTYQSGGQLYMARYNYKVYGLAFALTKVLVEDGDHVRIGQTYARHLAKSMLETKETLGANILNRSFNASFAGGDGVALVSTAHPTAVGTSSNRLATDANLSQSSLEQLLVQIGNATDSTGRKIRLKETKLVVGQSNKFQANVLLNSVLRTGTANNDVNPIKSMGMLDGGAAVLSRVTSTTAWWVQTDAPEGLKLAMRRKLEKSAEGDFESDSMRYKSTERYAFGWTDWRGLWGTPGL